MLGRRVENHEDGQLSIDFVIGFTIFMIAFIFVATMISGLLISLQSKSIDYDAVAYRTGVVLTEDPGEPFNWHLLDLSTFKARNETLKRLGLGISRNVPGILQESKVEKFFSPDCGDSTKLCYPTDYSQRLIFGDYPYRFNITLRELDETRYWAIGDEPPDKYGYIRRVVMIKRPGIALINTTNATSNELIIHMLLQNLYQPPEGLPKENPAYIVDPIRENLNISLRNFTIPLTSMTNLELYKYINPPSSPTPINIPVDSPTIRIYVDGNLKTLPALVTNDTSIIIEEGYFPRETINEFSDVEVHITFDKPVSDETYLGIENVAENPPLSRAVMEIKVW
jgi:hypothetical protein